MAGTRLDRIGRGDAPAREPVRAACGEAIAGWRYDRPIMLTRVSVTSSEPVRATPWRIELLGGIRARRERLLVTEFRTRRAAILLARLALNPRPHRRDELIGMLWPGVDSHAGRQNLSQSLSELRRRLETPNDCEFVFASRETVWLERHLLATDVDDFEQALHAARTASGAEQARHLERAVEIASAPLLPGIEYDWSIASRERITAECDVALRELVRWHESAGNLSAAFEFAWRRVRIDPLDEQAHREFAMLYERAERPAAGLRHLQVLEQDLSSSLGASPDDETRALADSLRGQLRQLARRAR
jgi:DNA-binding SARP family transcriptional activator